MKHKKFILTPISEMISDANNSISPLTKGLSTYPASTYIIQSLFIRVTGMQEQKMKCILWDFATHDYEFRTESTIGRNANITNGMSTYGAKEDLLNQMRLSVHRVGGDSTFGDVYKKSVVKKILEDIDYFFHDHPLSGANIRSFNALDASRYPFSEFLIISKGEKPIQKQVVHLFKDNLLNRYKDLYGARNQFAHNTLSFQVKSNSFRRMREADSGVCFDYFDWFSILMIIDRIFMDLYEKFIVEIESNPEFFEVDW